MLGLSWAETAVIMLVAIMVIGPKDLPPIIRSIKQAKRKLKEWQQEISESVNDVLKESGLEETARSLNEETAALNEEIRYIVDMDGNKQRVYDISDMKPEIIKGAEPHE